MMTFIAFAILAGCLGDDGVTENPPTGDDGGASAPEVSVPEDIHDSRMISGGVDPDFALEDGDPCTLPSEQCIEYPFTVEGGNVTIDVVLTWENPANDFDLHLYKADGTQWRSSFQNPPGTEESFVTTLDAADYILYVTPFTSGPDTYTLDATFS